MSVEMKEMKEMKNYYRRGQGPDAPVSDLTIDNNNDIPVSHEHPKLTPEEWHNFMLAACGCPESVCGVVIGR